MKCFFQLDQDNYVLGWSSTDEKSMNLHELDIPEDHIFFNQTAANKMDCFYIDFKNNLLRKDDTKELNQEKQFKLENLKEDCQKDILYGFDYNMGLGIFHFYYSETDQQNMLQNKYALEMGEESIPWRGYNKDGEPIDFQIKETQFNTMFKEAVRVKNYKLKLLREYYPHLISSLSTIKEVQEIKWDSSIEMG